MRINSFACSIITPVKTSQFPCATITPEKDSRTINTLKRMTRCSATAEQKRVLQSMERSHKFLCHGKVKYSELESRGLTLSSVEEIQRYFNENMPDIPDSILKQEEEAIELGEFCDKRRKYIAEDFEIPTEYSFLTICLLSYGIEHKVSVAESEHDLLDLFSASLICDECSLASEENLLK